MIVIKFSGGLGNQMYQYVIYKIMMELYPEITVKADLTFYKLLNEHNGFEIVDDFICENINIALKNEISTFCSKYIPGKIEGYLPEFIRKKIAFSWQYKFSKLKSWMNPSKNKTVITGYEINVYNPLITKLNVKNNSFYLDGLWQNMQYFEGYEEKILEWFKFKRKYSDKEVKVLELIKSNNAVSIHVRRGDFVKSTLDICGKEYYKKAIEIISNKINSPYFFVFTDDYDYASELFDNLKNKYIVKGNTRDAIYDMMLMSECKHNIISNSTFSFWASFLNKNSDKIVIAPKYCVKNDIGFYEFSTPKTYIKVEV